MPFLSRTNRILPSTLIALAICIGVVPTLSGCGGSSSSNVDSAGGATAVPQGRATVSIRWPDAGRLVPIAANSVAIRVLLGDRVLGSQVLARPANGGTSTATFDRLPVGALSVTATAFPNSDGTGVAQAGATTSVTVVQNQVAPVHLTMSSTVDHLEIQPFFSTVLVGRGVALTATARDSSGATVITSGSTFQWASSNTGVARIDSAGFLTALLPGTTQITVTETESGKSLVVPITVAAEPQPISWWKGENDAIDVIRGNNGVPTASVGYADGIFGKAFSLNGTDGSVNIPDSDSLKITRSVTIDTWVKVSAYPTAQWAMILFRGDVRGYYDPYFFGIQRDGRLWFGINSSDAAQNGDFELPTVDPLPLNQWVHLTATLDDATGLARIYVNGKVAAQAVTTIRPLRDLDPASKPGVAIGNHSSFPNGFYNYSFNGSIDEVKLYDQAVPPIAP